MGGGGVAGSKPMRIAAPRPHGAQIKIGDLTTYLTYGAEQKRYYCWTTNNNSSVFFIYFLLLFLPQTFFFLPA